MNLLTDPVFSVREAASQNIKNLVGAFGIAWAQNSILPKVLEFSTNPNYLFRMTTLLSINAVTSVVTGEVILNILLPTERVP